MFTPFLNFEHPMSSGILNMAAVLDEAKNYFIDNINNFQVKYLGEEGVNTAIVGAAAICSPWDLLVSK